MSPTQFHEMMGVLREIQRLLGALVGFKEQELEKERN